MAALMAFSRGIDRVTTFIGRGVAWLVLVAVLVSAGNAAMRKAFDMSSNAWLELQWYLFGAVFLMAAAWTLKVNEHVRIDVVAARLSKRTRDWIDLICHILFLLPFAGLMVYLAIPYVQLSYRQQEMSANAGGLIIWPAKALILAGFVLLLAQAVSEIIKRIAVIRGLLDDTSPAHDLPPVVEDALEMEADQIRDAREEQQVRRHD